MFLDLFDFDFLFWQINHAFFSTFVLVFFAMFGLFVIFFLLFLFNCYLFLFSIYFIVILMCFLFNYCVIFNMLHVCYFLKSMIYVYVKDYGSLNKLIKYSLSTHNGSQPTSRMVLGT